MYDEVGKAEEGTELQRLAEQCRGICDELFGVLERLKIQDESGKIIKWKSVNAAIKTVWKKEHIQQLQKRMDDIRQELIIHVLTTFRWVDAKPSPIGALLDS